MRPNTIETTIFGVPDFQSRTSVVRPTLTTLPFSRTHSISLTQSANRSTTKEPRPSLGKSQYHCRRLKRREWLLSAEKRYQRGINSISQFPKNKKFIFISIPKPNKYEVFFPFPFYRVTKIHFYLCSYLYMLSYYFNID